MTQNISSKNRKKKGKKSPMRQIQVISGSNEYLLEGDDGVLIGELIIKYEPKMFCEIAISKRESVMEYLSINVA